MTATERTRSRSTEQTVTEIETIPPARIGAVMEIPKLMETVISPNFGFLVKARAAAAREIGPIVKSKTADVRSAKGSYKFDYADLSAVIESIDEPLAKQGLAIFQVVQDTENDLMLVTILGHESGAWVRSEIPLNNADKDRVQELGSELTYKRRYMALAILGLAPEDDDDGNAADRNDARISDRDRRSASREERQSGSTVARTPPTGNPYRATAEGIQKRLKAAEDADEVRSVWKNERENLEEIRAGAQNIYEHLERVRDKAIDSFSANPAEKTDHDTQTNNQ